MNLTLRIFLILIGILWTALGGIVLISLDTALPFREFIIEKIGFFFIPLVSLIPGLALTWFAGLWSKLPIHKVWKIILNIFFTLAVLIPIIVFFIMYALSENGFS